MITTPFDSINLDYAKVTLGLDGTDVKLGQLETGITDSSNSGFSSGKTIITSGDTNNPVEASHATFVSLIMTGANGVAPDASLYSYALDTSDGLIEEFEWFVLNGVRIINISSALGGTCNTGYEEFTNYVDYISVTQKLTIVNSSGNNDCDDSYTITSPGVGSNVITVGGTNALGNALEPYSSYYGETTSDYKVNIVAPATGYGFPSLSPYSYDTFGTSFSAPMVTGAIALLIESDPTLIARPQSIAAILYATSNPSTMVESYRGVLLDSGLYSKVGAGFLDLSRLFNYDFMDSYAVNSITTAFSYSDYYVVGTDIRVASVWLRNQRLSYTTNVSDSDLDTFVYRNGGLYFANTSTDRNVEILDRTIIYSGVYNVQVKTVTILLSEIKYVIGATAIYSE